MNDRNYDTTGAKTVGGAGVTYVKLAAEKNSTPRFLIGKEEEAQSQIAGYLEKFDIEFSDGSPEHKVAPGWELVLTLSVKDDVRGTDTDTGGGAMVKLANYIIKVRMSHNYVTASILNVLAATDIHWDGWLKLLPYRKEGKGLRMSVKTAPGQGKNDFPPVKYPFDSATSRTIGVPEPIRTGVYQEGLEVLQWYPVQNFWLDHAKAFAARWAGGNYECNIGYAGAQGYKAGEPQGAGLAQQPTAAPPADKKAEPSKRDKFFSLLSSRMYAISGENIEDLEKLWNEVTKGGNAEHVTAWGTSIAELEAEFTQVYRNITGDTEGKFANGRIVANAAPAPKGDDLPF